MKQSLIAAAALILIGSTGHAGAETAETHESVAERFITREEVVKSGTPDVVKMLLDESPSGFAFKKAFSEAVRPERDAFADSPKGRFRVHYDIEGRHAPDMTDMDANGVPDYVDSTLVYLDMAWQALVVDLGYGAPSFDGTRGGAEGDGLDQLNLVDCYLTELSPQSMYGVSYPDDNDGSSTSYMSIDNDFTEPVYPTKGCDALKITTVHEFFHIIHYTYYGGFDSVWWMEQTAVWSEDYLWDGVNDYLNYLGFLFSERNTPLDSTNGNFMYGAALFAFHIANKYGTTMLRSIWSEMRDNRNGRIENMNQVIPGGLGQAVAELGVWMYFTGFRANSTDFFHDADIIRNLVVPEHTSTLATTADSLELRKYTFKYVDIEPEEGLSHGDSLYFDFRTPDGGSWEYRLILYSTPDNYLVMPLSGQQPSAGIPRPFEKAVLVAANVSQRDRYYTLAYTIDHITSKGVEKEPGPVPFVLEQNFPNPFNGATTIPFTVGEAGHVRLTVHDIRGARVATLVDRTMQAGYHEAPFTVPGSGSGMYYAVLESDGLRLTRKMLYLK